MSCRATPASLPAFSRTSRSRAPDAPVLSSDDAAESVRSMITPPSMGTHWPDEPDASRSLCKLGGHPGGLQTQRAGKAPERLSVMPKEPSFNRTLQPRVSPALLSCVSRRFLCMHACPNAEEYEIKTTNVFHSELHMYYFMTCGRRTLTAPKAGIFQP